MSTFFVFLISFPFYPFLFSYKFNPIICISGKAGSISYCWQRYIPSKLSLHVCLALFHIFGQTSNLCHSSSISDGKFWIETSWPPSEVIGRCEGEQKGDGILGNNNNQVDGRPIVSDEGNTKRNRKLYYIALACDPRSMEGPKYTNLKTTFIFQRMNSFCSQLRGVMNSRRESKWRASRRCQCPKRHFAPLSPSAYIPFRDLWS